MMLFRWLAIIQTNIFLAHSLRGLESHRIHSGGTTSVNAQHQPSG